MDQEDYTIKDAVRVKEVSPIADDKGTSFNQDTAEIACPSCGYHIPAAHLVLEGGNDCEGCGRVVRLYASTHDHYDGFRNVPADEAERYR